MKKIWIIIFLGLLIYGFALFNGFVWDDEVMFQNIGSRSASVYFRPAIFAVYWVIHSIFGSWPFFFHFFQLIFHTATAVLIFYLFKRFFKETVALILTLIFLVHPANVEAVSFASAMQEVAFTLTGTIGLYLFVIPSKEGIQTKMDSRIRGNDMSYVKVFLSTTLLLIALLIKETAIVFFVLVFCYLVLFKKNKRDVLINYSIFAVIFLLVYFLFRLLGGNFYVQGQGLFPIMRVSLLTRLVNIPSIIQYYLVMFLYPINLAIAQHWVVRTVDFQNFFGPLFIVAGFFLLFIVGFIYLFNYNNHCHREERSDEAISFFKRLLHFVRNDKDSSIYIFFLLWFLVGLLPHLQIIPLNMTVAERWLYFPMIGLLGMIGAILNKFEIRNSKSEIIFVVFAFIIIVLFSIRSFIRTLDWRNGLTLFGHDIKKNSSFDLQNNFGTELFRVGRYDEAKKYFEISTKLAPYWWVNWNNLGAIYEREKNYQKATGYYQKAIDNGQYYLAYENLARILVLHGKDQKKTEEFLKKSLELFPKNENLLRISDFYNQRL